MFAFVRTSSVFTPVWRRQTGWLQVHDTVNRSCSTSHADYRRIRIVSSANPAMYWYDTMKTRISSDWNEIWMNHIALRKFYVECTEYYVELMSYMQQRLKLAMDLRLAVADQWWTRHTDQCRANLVPHVMVVLPCFERSHLCRFFVVFIKSRAVGCSRTPVMLAFAFEITRGTESCLPVSRVTAPCAS